MRKIVIAAAVAAAAISTAAIAAVSFDPDTGKGFVGKGDVQLAYGGINNATVQSLNPVFTYNSTTITEVSWECTNSNNEKVQERSRKTTSSVQGLVSSVARVKNQVTGYNLEGFNTAGSSSTTSTDGPPLNSCPNNNSTYELTSPAGEPETLATLGGLYVDGRPLF